MIVLHAAQVARRLFVWGEIAEPPEPASGEVVAERAKRRVRADPPALPFGASEKALLAALEQIQPGVRADAEPGQSLTAWLPTVKGRPLASSPLIASLPDDDAPDALVPFRVVALPVHPPATIELLVATLDRTAVVPGMVAGADWSYWGHALRFAAALAARQQFVPALAQIESQWLARWEAVFVGADADRLVKLGRAMPHVCRSLASGTDAAASPPATPALTVLTAFVNDIVDHWARSGHADEPAPRSRRQPAFDSLHDQWLHALRSPDGRMEGADDQLVELATQIAAWRRPINATAAAPVKLCFRLEEPALEDDAWQLRFLLQPIDDPSLLIDTAEVWKGAKKKSALAAVAPLLRDGFNPKEYLLSGLGQASGIFPRIETSLRTTAPAACQLDAIGAHEFLTESAWALEQAGFGVLLPAWWSGKGTKLRLAARAQVKSPPMQAGGGLGLDAIVKFNWEIALGDTPLSEAELMALADLKTSLVKIRGQWVHLNADEIRAAIALWQQKTPQGRVRDVIKMALGAAPAANGLAFDGVRADGWIADLLAQLEGHSGFEELPVPAGLNAQLRAYQKRGFSWLAFLRRWSLGACLADDMGLGKTIQVLTLAQREREAGLKTPMLLVCPTSVTGNWQKEAARFTPELPVLVHHGTERTKGPAFARAAAKHALVVTSYALLHRDFELFKAVGWAAVVLDEAQNVKNPETKQAKAARALAADARIALTGTPVENNVGDLWSIMEFLNPGLLGTQSDFKRRFFVPIQLERDAESAARLKRLTGPFILRRLKTDKQIIADLPNKLEMKVYCPLTREQASLYAAVIKEAEAALNAADGIQRKGLVLATLMKLKQVCNHPAQFLGDNSAIAHRSGKLARLTEMLEEVLATGDRALVFTQFTEMGNLLQRHLQESFGREVLFLHGGVARTRRDRLVSRFQSDDDAPPIFLLSLKAGGTGLNLTRANHVFHFDRWWNPAVENQATDRAFRIGQTRNVQVHKFLCQGTLEERIDEMIERKKEIAGDVIAAGESWLTELSTKQLKELFALRADAVQE